MGYAVSDRFLQRKNLDLRQTSLRNSMSVPHCDVRYNSIKKNNKEEKIKKKENNMNCKEDCV
jgi:hypothetical protein